LKSNYLNLFQLKQQNDSLLQIVQTPPCLSHPSASRPFKSRAPRPRATLHRRPAQRLALNLHHQQLRLLGPQILQIPRIHQLLLRVGNKTKSRLVKDMSKLDRYPTLRKTNTRHYHHHCHPSTNEIERSNEPQRSKRQYSARACMAFVVFHTRFILLMGFLNYVCSYIPTYCCDLNPSNYTYHPTLPLFRDFSEFCLTIPYPAIEVP
jgi:hypothetical protein